MHKSVSGTYGHRVPWKFYPASYLEKFPSVIGLVGSGTVLTVRPELWPGAWAWLLIGPLLLARILAPVLTRMTFRWEYSAGELRVVTGLFTTEDVLKIQRRLVELSPSVALTKRERTRGRD